MDLADAHFDTGAGTVMATCHHKRIHQKDLVITRILIFGAACTHPLVQPMLPQDHPSSTNQASIDRAKVQDLVFKEQCDTATLNAIHHHQEEHMRMSRDELQNLPLGDRNLKLHRNAVEVSADAKSEQRALILFCKGSTDTF